MAKVHFLEFELKLFLLIAAFLINNDSFFFSCQEHLWLSSGVDSGPFIFDFPYLVIFH